MRRPLHDGQTPLPLHEIATTNPFVHFEQRLRANPKGAVSACHGDFSIDSVTADLLPCTPPGWQERVTLIELAPCIITVMRLEQLHDGNPIPDEERTKVEKSLRAVRDLGY